MDYTQIREEIKERLDIVQYISNYVNLTKKGNNFSGICPFHAENTPSFTVSPQKNMFHCFGCGVGGDIFTFTMKMDGINYFDAINKLAKQAGIHVDISETNKTKNSQYTEILNIQRTAMDFFINNLKNTSNALEYLKKRGLDDNTIERFGVGYAVEHWDMLYKHIRTKGYTQSAISGCGLFAAKQHGFYDTFRSRITFPIFNTHSEPIAFGGRLTGEGSPKYLNSPETAVFKKKNVLYGLNMAKDTIFKANYIIIVEGYMDTLMCHQYGITNAVAPLGTALTDSHVQIIKRYTKNLVVIFDGDRAGINAAKRALAIIYAHGLEAKVLSLPTGDDPDSFLRKNGLNKFLELLNQSLDFIDFMLQIAGKTTENIEAIYTIINNISDKILKSKLTTTLAERAGISESIIRENVKKPTKYGKIATMPKSWTGPSEEEYLLMLSLNYPECFKQIKINLSLDEFDNPLVKKSFNKLYENSLPSFDALSDYLSETELACLTAHINNPLINPAIDDDELAKTVSDCINKIKRKRVELELRKKIQSTTDEKILCGYVEELMTKKRQMLKG
ncbi:MAG: DNA primase [Candidatus Magnetoovum sp. WYHC-5]|nr:DNA primase [Candidatus Magnetoovum sp. WYHC-5]